MSGQPTARQQRLGAAALRAMVDEAGDAGRIGDADVVGDTQVRQQRQFLEHADEAVPHRIQRVGELHGRPSTSMLPPSGRTAPAMILISVLLPAPFSPSTAWMEPRRQAKSTPSSAVTPP